MAALGVPMFPHAIVRGQNQQEAAFAAGHSKARFGQSAHNFGMAVDLIHGVKAWQMDKKAWEIIGHIGKELAMSKQIHVVWGGDFKSLWDPAHWELRDWKQLKEGYPFDNRFTKHNAHPLTLG